MNKFDKISKILEKAHLKKQQEMPKEITEKVPEYFLIDKLAWYSTNENGNLCIKMGYRKNNALYDCHTKQPADCIETWPFCTCETSSTYSLLPFDLYYRDKCITFEPYSFFTYSSRISITTGDECPIFYSHNFASTNPSLDLKSLNICAKYAKYDPKKQSWGESLKSIEIETKTEDPNLCLELSTIDKCLTNMNNKLKQEIAEIDTTILEHEIRERERIEEQKQQAEEQKQRAEETLQYLVQ